MAPSPKKLPNIGQTHDNNIRPSYEVHGMNATTNVSASLLEEMANNHSLNFSQHRGRTLPVDNKRRVLLTGSTGTLGSFILHDLVMDARVADIYCINRPAASKGVTLLDRHKATFLDKGLPVEILRSKKVHLVEGSLHEQLFGLEEHLYRTMQQSVTHIVHSAWPVNLTIPLQSFVTAIKGLRNLINFALASPLCAPPSLMFLSTTFIFGDLSRFTDSLPEVALHASTSIGSGYTESKWVGEQMLISAAKQTRLTTIVVRVGQICGGPNGSWKISEWFPSVVHSANYVSCLPERNGCVAWLPVHVAANAVIDYLNISKPSILHLTHPHPVRYKLLADRIAKILDVPIVPFDDWVALVQAKGSSTREMRAGRLMSVYTTRDLLIKRRPNLVDSFGLAYVEVKNGVAESPSLATAKPLSIADVDRWLKYWFDKGYMCIL